jgi:hypothetical protein
MALTFGNQAQGEAEAQPLTNGLDAEAHGIDLSTSLREELVRVISALASIE